MQIHVVLDHLVRLQWLRMIEAMQKTRTIYLVGDHQLKPTHIHLAGRLRTLRGNV